MDASFFLMQVYEDSINQEILSIEEEEVNTYLKKVIIKPKDSLLHTQTSSYYLHINEEN